MHFSASGSRASLVFFKDFILHVGLNCKLCQCLRLPESLLHDHKTKFENIISRILNGLINEKGAPNR